MIVNQKVQGFNEMLHTCSPSIEWRRVILIIVVTQLAVRISESKFDAG